MPSVSSREPTTTEVILDQLDQLLFYRYRHVSGPVFMGGLCFGLAALANHLGAGFPFLLTVITLLIVALGWDSVQRQPDRPERLYAGTCWIWAGAWTILAGWVGPAAGEIPFLRGWLGWSISPMIALWVMGFAILMPPWVRHRRVRRAVDISKKVMAWDGDAVGLPFTRLSHAGAGGDEDSWWAPITCRVKGMYTLSKLRDAKDRIAARFGVTIADIEIYPTHEDEDGNYKEGAYYLKVRETVRPKGGAPYPIPESRPDIDMPTRIGNRVDDPDKGIMCELFRPDHGGVHSLTVGSTGYGKTTLFKQLCLHSIAAHNALLFLGDMKPGNPDYHEIGTRGAYVFATNHDEIDTMIHALLILSRVRGEANKRGGIPMSQRIRIFTDVDETALYFADEPTVLPDGTRLSSRAINERARSRMARWKEYVLTCRAYYENIWTAAQLGKEANLGKDARSQLLSGQILGFFSPKPTDSALVSADDNFRLWELPRGVKGLCKIQNGVHPDPTTGHLYNVTDDIIEETLTRFADGQGDLMPDEIEALERELGDKWRLLRERTNGPMTIDGQIVVTEPVPLDDSDALPATPSGELPRRHSTAQNSQEAVLDALRELGRPASVHEVSREIRKSETLVRKRLRELVRDGRVRRFGVEGEYTYSVMPEDK